MSLLSIRFVGFLVIVAIVYHLLPSRGRKVWLLIASYFFMMTWSWVLAVLVAALTTANYVIGRTMERQPKTTKRLLYAGIGLNVLILIVFKYADFFVPDALARLEEFGVNAPGLSFQLLIPLGLSYIVLQTISYLVDVSRRQMQFEYSFVDFAVYVGYFPKILSGPIEHAREFIPKLQTPALVDNQRITENVTLVIEGLVRKLVFSNLIRIVYHPSNAQPDRMGFLSMLLWLIAMGVIIYFDFSGYTNIVRGISGLLGIDLSRNFNYPFYARSASDLWSRWHMSLTSWLREYIYLPMTRALLSRSKNKVSWAVLALPPIVTLLIAGVWHSFALNMLIWGIMQGTVQAAERVITPRPVTFAARPVWQQGIVVALVPIGLLSFVPFMMDVQFAQVMLPYMLNFTPQLWGAQVIPVIALALLVDWLEFCSGGELFYLRLPRYAQVMLLSAAMLSIFLLATTKLSTVAFVYQGF